MGLPDPNEPRATLFARYIRKFDISVFDKSVAFPAFYNGSWPGPKSDFDILRKFELIEFDISKDISRFDCTYEFI